MLQIGGPTVSTTPVAILPPSAPRSGYIITNDGNVKVYLAIGYTARAGEGIPLGAGDSLTIEGHPESGAASVSAVTNNGSTIVSFQTL